MSTGDRSPTLVVLQLTGGNDSLNTIVPYATGRYYDRRPVLAVPQDEVLPIDNQLGFNPNLAAIKPFWDQGKMAIVSGVGYRNPSFSHFRSMDIWHTAEPDKVSADGWLGKTVRALDPQAENVLTAVSIGRGLPRALSFAGTPAASVAQLDTYGLLTSLSSVDERNSALQMFSSMYDDGLNDDMQKRPLMMGHPDDPRSKVIKYMGRTGLDAKRGAEILSSALGKYGSTVAYPTTPIGANLRAIAQVKLADLGTRILYTQHAGFDTHANQAGTHDRLVKEMSDAVAAFFTDLWAHDAAEDVVMLVFSEFGRRIADNGGGTDHGAAGIAFLLGDAVKGGLYGEYPSLEESRTPDGNLIYTNDFRSMYSAVLERWLKVEAEPVVNGAFEQFAFL